MTLPPDFDLNSTSLGSTPILKPIEAPLLLGEILAGKNLVVVGGTGFLGKVWLSLLLDRFPDIGHIYLVVRPKGKLGVEKRFEEKILTSEVFHPLRKKYADDFASFISEKVTPIAGDVTQPYCGTTVALRDEIRGQVAAVINVAGVVDFAPPLDEALEVNAFGCQNLVALARDLGDAAVLHTSTCFTAGSRTGPIEELDPREIPFPRVNELDIADWDPDREISECLDVITQARHRAGDAFRQSRFLDEAKENLRRNDEPGVGKILEEELFKVKRRFVEKQLAELGVERAKHWGWPNTYTYTKSIGEQIVASSGLPFTIVRPAIVESTNEFPFPGWNEGINTSAPFIFLIREGGLQLPGGENNLDMIPCDMVCGGILLALGELIEGNARPVYQLGASDRNPCTMARFFELSGLHKRRLYRTTGKGGPIVSALQQRFETGLLSKEEYESYGPRKLAQGAKMLSGLFKKAGAGPLQGLLKPAATSLESFASQQEKIARVMDTFLPFTAELHYIFKTDAVYAAYERLGESERLLVPWGPENLDWREWFLEVHAPALERHVFPEMEKRFKKKELKAPRSHGSLTLLLDGMAERYGLKVALSRTEKDGLSRLSYEQLQRLSLAAARRLRDLGVEQGSRVLLMAKNHPAWPIAFFAIQYAGATAVPVDETMSLEGVLAIKLASRAQILITDEEGESRIGSSLGLPIFSLAKCLEAGELLAQAGARTEDVAALIYTSGTTGEPKGVMLTHGNLTALIASLAPVFPLTAGDSVLSVLPLHHTFELTCGLLLPLSRGARITYLDELSGERLSHGLKAARATALVGVPALWEMLERRISTQVAEKGPAAEKAFEIAVEMSRAIGNSTGIDLGRSLFGAVHQGLGGHLKYLVSGGASLNADTHALFQGLGLHLSEGYGLTEAAPVLSVAKGGPRSKPGHVGRPVPGVELRIENANEAGVGQVLARGANVMKGYSDNPQETARVIDSEGWLATGDLGRIDGRGHLTLVGRQKDVVVASNGENIYPDDLETHLGKLEFIEEYCFLGVPGARGGERLACVLVPEQGRDIGVEGARRAQDALQEACARLPMYQRPSVVFVRNEKFERTSTKKVKRNELRKYVEQISGEKKEAESSLQVSEGISRSVFNLLGSIAKRTPDSISSAMTLRGDLGFDSLMSLELLHGLELKLGRALDSEKLAKAVSVQELLNLLKEGETQAPSRTSTIEGETSDELPELPPAIRNAFKQVIGGGQANFYEKIMRTKVVGRTFIPHNQRTLVVANHASHLDMGLVKYALGTYGEGLMTLAAQDYFFEGNRYRKAFFNQLTNLVPMSRSGSLRGALRDAGALLDKGKTLLIFPEGTRGEGGGLRPFKASMGHLALHHSVDILPVWLEGTSQALPKGASFLKSRELEARIGPPLSIKELRKVTQGLSASESSRVVSRIAHLAMQALEKSQFLNLSDIDVEEIRRAEVPVTSGLQEVFDEIKVRFVPGVLNEPLCYYFSLGDERWTVRATASEIEVTKGKTGQKADCVLKTSPKTFERIVREAWVPGPKDFMSGEIKTNHVAHLLAMQKLFRLSVVSAELPGVLKLPENSREGEN